MAYSDATFAKLRTEYKILQDYQDFKFNTLVSIPPSTRLAEDIAEGTQMTITSEKAKS